MDLEPIHVQQIISVIWVLRTNRNSVGIKIYLLLYQPSSTGPTSTTKDMQTAGKLYDIAVFNGV